MGIYSKPIVLFIQSAFFIYKKSNLFNNISYNINEMGKITKNFLYSWHIKYGDRNKLFKKIWNKYYKKLYYYISIQLIPSQELIEDVTQEVFIKIYKKIDLYEPKYSFSTWIYRIAKNYCIDMNKTKIKKLEFINDIETIKGPENIENSYNTKILLKKLDSVIESLDSLNKEISS